MEGGKSTMGVMFKIISFEARALLKMQLIGCWKQTLGLWPCLLVGTGLNPCIIIWVKAEMFFNFWVQTEFNYVF